jgi:nitrogen regulatory protein PII
MKLKEKIMMNSEATKNAENLKLVVFIVPKGMGTKVSKEARKLGATRRVILLGHGTAPKKIYLDILGIDYEPEKEILMMVVKKKHLRNLIDTLTHLSQIDRPAHGIAFVVDISCHAGWLNFLQVMPEEQLQGGKHE